MFLSAGTRLGIYEVGAQIGAGGPAFAERGLRPELRPVRRSQERTW